MAKKSLTDEELIEFTRLWNADFSGSQIAKILGMSRNSVLGRAHRMQKAGELARRGAPVALQLRPGHCRRPHPRPRNRNSRSIQMKLDVQQELPRTEIIELPDDFSDRATHLSNLERGQCRWVLGEARNFMFCGAVQIDNCSYCQRHALRSYNANYRFRPRLYGGL